MAAASSVNLSSRLSSLALGGQAEPCSETHDPEASLRYDVDCSKNPRHPNFIPVTNFTADYLPPFYRSGDILKWIQNHAELTVHLTAGRVSMDRPDKWADTYYAYPFVDSRGRNKYRVGSGFVCGIAKCGVGGERHCDGTCTCETCSIRSSPKRKWWEVEIATAAHVTFDETEVKDTDVRFFFDEGHSELVVSKGHGFVQADANEDWCVFRVVLHTKKVVDRLERARRVLEQLERNVFEDKKVFHGLVAVISHPHGCSKHITIGHLEEDAQAISDTPIIHDAGTCPGSSGGAVIVRGWYSFGNYVTRFPHSESLRNGRARAADRGWGLMQWPPKEPETWTGALIRSAMMVERGSRTMSRWFNRMTSLQ